MFCDINIHTNFYQNQSINECSIIFWHKSGLIWPWMTFASSYCWPSWKVFKKLGVKQKYIVEKDDLEILRWPYVIFNDLWGHTLLYEKNCVSIMLAFIEIFYQNRFINEYSIKNPGITESQIPRVMESRSFLVRYRRTYALNNSYD